MVPRPDQLYKLRPNKTPKNVRASADDDYDECDDSVEPELLSVHIASVTRQGSFGLLRYRTDRCAV